jgi:hypothetical protein
VNEQGDQNPADKLLAGYRPPRQVLIEKAWADLDEDRRAELDALKGEQDAEGRSLWQGQVLDDEDDPRFEVLYLVPVDPADPRMVRVGGWTKQERTDAEERARAIAKEHNN